MKFNPNCNVKNLEIWLNAKNPPKGYEDTFTHFDTQEILDGAINIDGWVSARQIEILHQWFESNKQK